MENTYVSTADKYFVTSTLTDFITAITDAQEPETDPEKCINLRDHNWILRMLYSLVNRGDAHLIFSRVYDSMDRWEFDCKKKQELPGLVYGKSLQIISTISLSTPQA